LASNEGKVQNGLGFFYTTLAQVTYFFFPTSTPGHPNFFGEFDWEFEQKEKKKEKKVCILSP